ncbi:MAG TPA: glycoside hydrolase family 127 protein [Fimbriimonas sp.]
MGAAPAPADYPVKPVPFTAVKLTDRFWAPKLETNREISIPFAFERCEESGRVDLFERAAKALRGEPLGNRKAPGYPFDDTDVYKVLEGAAYSLSVHPDPKLEAYVDGLIDKIAAAQEPDGYLYTTRTINPEAPHDWSGKERWVLEQDNSHELYNLGHMFEAAVAHYQATGKRSLLNVAIKSADLLDRTFGPGKKKVWPGHQIVEMGLVRLGRVTHQPRYLALAKFFLDSRGGSGEYWQAHLPPVEQTEAVGHAVRATYMYSGMADVAAILGDKAYAKAIQAIWNDVVGRKLYVTGGIGATGAGEAFGPPYELPNMSAYCETCAQIGNDFWNQRLFQMHGDAKYVDVFERTLYNGLISGASLDGKGWFYPNPLESRGQHQRSPWFGVACCPGNMTRFLPSLPGYFYGQQGSTIYANLYAASTADVKLDGGRKVQIVQETNYPWDGEIKLTVRPDRAARFALNLRVPGWARNEPVPSDLYRFAEKVKAPVVLKVNGKTEPVQLQKGYAVLNRSWKKGDTVELSLPMPIRRVVANEKVKEDVGKVALQRGPVVYCAEWPDNPGGIRNLLLPDEAVLNARFRPDLLKGVTTLVGTAKALAYDPAGNVVEAGQPFTAIPYYAWANRGRGEMMVWIPNTPSSARPKPQPSIASQATLKTSGGNNPRAINDQDEPKSSIDHTSFFHWWPKKGTTEWVEMSFEQPTTVSEALLYWFDDTGIGECRLPESWRLLYRDGDEWKPVAAAGAYGVEKDVYNKVAFAPVATTALRIEVKLRDRWSAGIQEWKVR